MALLKVSPYPSCQPHIHQYTESNFPRKLNNLNILTFNHQHSQILCSTHESAFIICLKKPVLCCCALHSQHEAVRAATGLVYKAFRICLQTPILRWCALHSGHEAVRAVPGRVNLVVICTEFTCSEQNVQDLPAEASLVLLCPALLTWGSESGDRPGECGDDQSG